MRFNLVCWLAFALAMSLGRIGEMPAARIVVTDWALAALGFPVGLALTLLYRRADLWSAGAPRIFGLGALASYAGGAVWTAAYHLYARHLATPLHHALTGSQADLAYRGPLLDDTVYNALTLLAWGVIYVGFAYARALTSERERRLVAEAGAHEARLQALRFQLNPHFLFNTLNAVSTLVVEKKTDEATAMISRLSDFLRMTLAAGDDAVVPLERELEFTRRYVEIERIRFGDRLRVDFDVDPAVLGAGVPVLILQPLIENAIKHAVAERPGGAVAVRAARRGEALVLSVADSGSGSAAKAPAGMGIGLENTRRRLAELYPGAHRFTTGRSALDGLEVGIEIPLEAPAPRLQGGGAP